MEQITLIKRNGTTIKLFNKEPFRTVKTATQSKSLMGVDTVTLSILSRDILSFDKGDRIVVNGENYYIRTKVNRELTPNGYFKYDAVFYGVLYDLMKTPYRNMDASGNSSTSTFDLVYDLKEYIRVLINNTQKDYPGWWVFDETGCPDKDPIPFQFSCNNCLAVLQQVCQKFKVDFRITQRENVRTIQIGHFGSNITPPDGSSYFEWGRGKGLYSLKENKVDDKAIKTRLWVEGGTSNLPTGYRDYAMRLQLPLRRKNKNAHTLSDGTVIAANSEYIGITSENARYIEDTALSNALGVDADSVLYDEIVPTRTGSVTAIYSSGENPDYLSFADSSMDFDINEHLVNNVSAKVTFITGKLAGQTLEISKYDATTKKFTLIPYQDSRGLTIPTEDSAAFRIGVGDRYKLTDIVMPQSVIDNAEEDLWYAGYDDLCKLKQARVQYSMELNRMKLLEDMPTDSDTVLFKPGDYVPIKDTRFGVQKNIRIQKVERNLLIRHDYQLTISDTATIDIYTQAVIDTQSHETIIINNQLKDLTKMRRGWRTTEELRNMVFDTDGFFDTDNFRANSIDTNMLTVGSKSQQFVLSDVVIQPNYDGDPDRIVISGGSLSHLTINEDGVRTWQMAATDTRLSNTTGYYLYARCPKSGNNAAWLITQTQYKPDPDGEFYYFLVGIIGSKYVDDNFRDFTTTYGFTRINGNTITTGKIQSSNGECYFDLDNNLISGNITIRSGSGYDNLTDKPDLSVYSTVASLNVVDGKVLAVSNRVDTVEQTISSAGWITSADGNLLWASKSLEDGNEIISYINQNATTITIASDRVNLLGAVTFSMFSSSLQTTINDKANTADLGSLALKSGVAWTDLVSALQNTINGKANSADLGSLASLNRVDWANLTGTVQSTISGKADSSSLGSLATLNSVAWSNLASAVQSTINNKLESVAWSDLTNSLQSTINEKLTTVTWNDLATALQNVINAKLTSVAWNDLTSNVQDIINSKAVENDIADFAFDYSSVYAALVGETVIVGGYLNSNYIDVNHISATSGSIGGWNISSGGLTASTSGGYFICGDNSTHFLRINHSDAFLSIRNDTNESASYNKAVSISAYGNNAVGMYIIAQAGDNSIAINCSGDVRYNVRSGESFRISGDGFFAPACAFKSSSFTLPTSNVPTGSIYFVKGSNVTVSTSGYRIKASNSSSTTSSYTQGADSAIYVYDGYYWCHFCCD